MPHFFVANGVFQMGKTRLFVGFDTAIYPRPNCLVGPVTTGPGDRWAKLG
jgi:hypothetical protein